MGVISLTTGKMVSIPARAMERKEYNFLIICRYLNLVKKSEDNFIANRKLKLLQFLNFCIELCLKLDLFVTIKGN